jgi:hypothetical protein
VEIIVEEKESVKITDFRLAGFLVSRGAKFLGTDVNHKGEVVFSFCSGGGDAVATHDLLTAYPGSLEQRYDAACKTMHDLVKVVLMNARRPKGGG